jgi:hypothetical protein
MLRLIAIVLLAFGSVLPVHAELPVTGTYRLVSFVLDVDGVPSDVMGKFPRGYLILTPTRWLSFITAEHRKFGPSIEEKAALWESLAAYSGQYRIDGNKIVVSVDTSSNEIWNGSELTRTWALHGNRLHITTAAAPYLRNPAKTAVARLIWEKV